jgi:CsoR family transcriptional regulator, copper-sensing transcriptional repressor
MQEDVKQDLLRRLRTIEGHVAGLGRMVEQGQYCIEVIDQVTAVQRSLDKVATIVLENHLHTCVRQAMSAGGEAGAEERERIIDELVSVYAKAASR